MLLTRAIIARILPFAVYILFLGFNDVLSQLLLPVLHDVRWLYAIRIAVVALLLIWFWRDYAELNRAPKLKLQIYLISVVVGLLVFAIWIMPYPAWAMTSDATGFNPSQPDGENIDMVHAMIRLSGAALVVPLMEELFWRSFLMRWLRNQSFTALSPAAVGKFAFVSTAVLFGLEHSLWLAGVVAGLAYGGLYMHTNKLWAPVIAHAVTNGVLGLWVIRTSNWQYW